MGHAMGTNSKTSDTQPPLDASVWPPRPSSSIAPEDQPVETTVRFFVGFLHGLFLLLASGVVWVILMLLFWQYAQFNAHLSRLLLHDFPSTWYGKAIFPASFLLCNLPALTKFVRLRLYLPLFAWGVLLGSCSATLTWLAVSWYITRSSSGI